MVGLVFAIALPPLVWSGVQVSSSRDPSEIMETMVDPAANFIWDSVSTVVTSEGVEEKSPRTDKEWNDLRRAASRLGDGGKLLKQLQRGGRNGDWQKWAQAVVDAADATLKAVDARNADRVFEVGEEIYNTCVGCHGGYWRMADRRVP